MHKHKWIAPLLALALLAQMIFLVGCGLKPSSSVDLAIASGSENETLEPLVMRFAKRKGYNIEMTYMGSVDMMLGMSTEYFAYDAVWPAHSLWISLGDEELKRVKHEESIMRSPVVFGIKRSLAEELGFVGRDVTVGDILDAVQAGKLTFMMTNAAQSNSGATAYLGFLYSFLGNPEVITGEDLQDPDLAANMRALLGGVNRSSGSSGWLKDLYLSDPERYDGLVNYESMIIEINQQLTKDGHEPLYVVYPVDGQAISDSPLGYVDKGDEDKEAIFLELQQYLLSEDVQSELLANGRRTGLVGLTSAEVDPEVFNPAWGIDTTRVINQIRLPAPEVIRQALDLYQTAFKKPSLTIFCLDYSGSMYSEGEQQLEEAMSFLLDQDKAAEYLIQTGTEDITVVIPFSSAPQYQWVVQGNDQDELSALLRDIQRMEPVGGTDIYAPAIQGLDYLAALGDDVDQYQAAIILMTDGRNNSSSRLRDLEQHYAQVGLDVPIFGILFGSADESELQEIADLTHGRVFDGTTNLITAFRNARGYN